MAIEMRCVCRSNCCFVCKQYEQKPGRNGFENKQNMERQFKDYAEYETKYEEYGNKCAVYETKYQEYAMKYAKYAMNMQNVTINILNK
jgi:hypothetical protein